MSFPDNSMRADADGDPSDIRPLSALTTAEIIALYDDLLRPSFRPEELVSIGDVLRLYAGEDPAPSGVLVRDGRPLGVHLCEAYVDGRVLLLTHLAVSPDARRGGIGSQLLDHAARQLEATWPGAVVLAEVDDPRVWPGTEATGDPVARLQFYGRHGARLVRLSYVMPELQPGAGRVAGMFLMRLDRHGRPAPGLLRSFLAEYYTTCEGADSLTDPAVRAVLEAAAEVDLDRDLLPTTDWGLLPVATSR